MKIICGFQYELYTTDEQRSALSRNAGCRRFVFNKALELQNELRKNGLSLLRYKELWNWDVGAEFRISIKKLELQGLRP